MMKECVLLELNSVIIPFIKTEKGMKISFFILFTVW